MSKKLCSDDRCYPVLSQFIGKQVQVKEGRRKFSGDLSIWTAKNGNEGWLVGDMDNGPWILFSGDSIGKIEVDQSLDFVTVRIAS